MRRHPVGEAHLSELVALYQRCEAFIRLGTDKPIDAAMVQMDLDISRREGGRFEGMYSDAGELIGVLDVACDGYEGEARQLASPFCCRSPTGSAP